MGLLKTLFTWWNSQNLGTWLDTRFAGREVGRDADGNIYYESRDASRRWVVYAGETDSSRVPPEWHLWLHWTRKEPPTEVPLPAKAWERPWRPNPTGTQAAELPAGALRAGGVRAPSAADYRAWTPDDPAGG